MTTTDDPRRAMVAGAPDPGIDAAVGALVGALIDAVDRYVARDAPSGVTARLCTHLRAAVGGSAAS